MTRTSVRRLRRLLLAVHLTASVGWVGAVLAYLPLSVTAGRSAEPETIRAMWVAMDLLGWSVLVPLALAAFVSGVVLALASPWGLFRYWWVVVSLGATFALGLVLVLHMPEVSASAARARTAAPAELRALDGDTVHAGVGLALLLAVLGLNVVKPRGLTRYGWRRQQVAR
ncbi:DUF2269 domain-containing protein [Nocardioides sp.]|uniref:DUF2269 domain-containing protein n=1 Tax=Nocardioides sp. TaxID=35761 RepID=UPI002C44DE67|nr:DUF2269 domain-containing protein [Nocardioides sp.]HSX67409.1 DUF2269 domain-containing protein [Nocardioides sp.]